MDFSNSKRISLSSEKEECSKTKNIHENEKEANINKLEEKASSTLEKKSGFPLKKRKAEIPGVDDSNKIHPKKKANRRRKRQLEDGAPRPPLTGYVRFMTERREQLKVDHPNKNHIEMTKLIADEWSRLTEEDKAPYLKVAEAERAAYNNAMTEFYNKKKCSEQENKNPINGNLKMANNNSKYSQMNGNSSGNNNGTKFSTADNKSNSIPSYYPDGSIPIFTDEFLDHNKTVDLELRALRKANIDYEQQNSVLEKHIENMKTGVEKIESENKELAEKNRLMQKYLDKLKAKLAQALSGLPLPMEPNGATIDNIDKYMTDLVGMASSNSHNVNKAKDIIRKLDLHISL